MCDETYVDRVAPGLRAATERNSSPGLLDDAHMTGDIVNPATRFIRDIAQSGSAFGLGPKGRRFESCYPD